MLEWEDATVYEALSTVADRRPGATALFFEGETIRYDELRDRSLAFARGLVERGVDHGDTIAVWLANRPEWVIAQFGASYLGASVVAVNTRYRKHELEYMLQDSGAAALVLERSFLDRDYLEMVSDLAPALKRDGPDSFDPERFVDLESIIAVESAPEYPAVESFDDVSAAVPVDPDPARGSDLPVAIFYTSGTTGDPKGCVHGSHSVLNHAYNIGSYFELAEEDVGLGAIPFCGSYGYNVWLSCLSHGVPLVVQSHFDPEETVELVDRYAVTYFSATAQMYLRLIEAETFAPERVESLRRGAMFFANGFDESAFERIEAAAGFPVVQPYGLSEANTQLFVGNPEAPKEQRKKVGGPLIHEDLEARIVDRDTHEELPAGERGELALRGYNVMQGYLDKPEATAEVVDADGWFYTGDLCERDERNRFYYHARIDDALRVRGFLVSPGEIESAIDAHPAVEMSQVVGAPHPRHGEVPVAFIKPSGDLSETEIVAFLEERVADYKLPEDAIFVDEFPRTEGPHGEKIQKSALRDRVDGLYD